MLQRSAFRPDPKPQLLGNYCIPKQKINKGQLIRRENLVPAQDQGQVIRFEVMAQGNDGQIAQAPGRQAPGQGGESQAQAGFHVAGAQLDVGGFEDDTDGEAQFGEMRLDLAPASGLNAPGAKKGFLKPFMFLRRWSILTGLNRAEVLTFVFKGSILSLHSTHSKRSTQSKHRKQSTQSKH